jgi:exonuclease SbcC
MIKSIKLTNFQRHKDSLFKFTPGVNIISGKTKAGKSSIVRALRYVSENRPITNKYERRGQKGFVIDVEFDDGVVSRVKDKGNKYILNGKELNAVGTDVPEEVSQFFGFNDFSLQGQFDAVKFLTDSPGKVAKYINSITKQEIIEEVTKNINTEVKNITDEKNTTERLLLENEQKLTSLSELTKLKAKKDKIQNKIGEHTEAVKIYYALSVIVDNVNELNKKIESFADLESLSKEVNKVIEAHKEYQGLKKWNESLLSLICGLSLAEGKISKLKNIDKLSAILKMAEEEKQELNEITEVKRKINFYIKSLESIQLKTEELNKEIEEQQGLLSGIDICPLCGNKWEQK